MFTLLPVALEKVDLLEARLRDAHDEIEALRAGSTPSFLSISSKSSCPNNEIVLWDGDGPIMSASHFKLSEDFKQVTILKTGVYQVNLRLGGHNKGNGNSTGLQLNGTDSAICVQCETNNQQNSAHINAILKLSVNDLLQVRCGFSSSSLPSQTTNNFTILFLGQYKI